MNDMLDFSAVFWEDLLDNQPPLVDNNSIKPGEFTYATGQYFGVDVAFLRMQELRPAKREWFGFIQSASQKQKSKSVKHYSDKN